MNFLVPNGIHPVHSKHPCFQAFRPWLLTALTFGGTAHAALPSLEPGHDAPSGILVQQELPPSQPDSDPLTVDSPLRLPRLLWTDTIQVFKAPGKWTAEDRHVAWWFAAGLAGSIAFLDEPARREANHLKDTGHQQRWKHIGSLGGAASIGMAGCTYLTGLIFRAPEPRAVGADMLMTMAISQLAIVTPVKYLAGRSEDDPHRFRPFSRGRSFPSGHTTQAFAMASVLATHTDNPWIQGSCYAVASLVGVARVAQGEHYPSDVLAGALIDTLVGRVVVHSNEGLRHQGSITTALEPAFVQGNPGLALRIRF